MAEQHADLSFKPDKIVLSLLSKERGVYGLRNGDHERYRRHCTNKVQRLRQVTNLQSGKGKVYKQPPPVTAATAKDVRHLQLVLFSAERALAHSHELKSVLQRQPNAATRKDQISWLRRALKFSESLHSLVSTLSSPSEGSAKVDTRTLAEVTIYHLSLRSELAFERSQWAETITDLAVRRRLLSTLSDAARDSYDQALAAEFIDSYDPLIRFAAYKLGRAESHDIEGVVADIDEEMQEEALPGVAGLVDKLKAELGSAEMEAGRANLEDIQFAGEKVEMRSAEIVKVMVKVQEVLGKQKAKGKGMRGWDRVLAVLGDAEAVARKLVDDHEASGSSSSLRSTDTLRALQRAHQYIVHLLLSHRIKRDLQLVDTLQTSSAALPADPTKFKVPGGKTKLEEAVKTLGGIIKLYDTVLQSLGQIRDLGIVQDKDEVRVGVEGAENYFHATRNYFLARLHTIHPTPSYASAVRLLARSSSLVEQSRASLFESGIAIEEPIVDISSADLDKLASTISALDLAAKRALFAERVEKPVFFDTAFNYVELPLDELLVRAGKQPTGDAATSSSSTQGTAAAAIQNVAQSVANVAPAPVASAVKGIARATRERTPAVQTAPRSVQQQRREEEEEEEDKDEGEEQVGQQGQKKGWLGGWFGRK